MMTRFYKSLALATLLLLAGCSSLQYAGHSEYVLKPMLLDGKAVCCEVSIKSGREIGQLKAHVEKGYTFTMDLEINGLAAFTGQAIAAEAVKGVAGVVP